MESRRPQLSVTELHQLKWLLGGLLILLSVWTVFYLEFDAWTLMGVATVAVIAALVKPRWPGYVPAWMHRLAFPAIVAFFLGDLWVTGEVLPAIVRLDLVLLLYRGVTYRKKRDDLQVIVLGLFLIVVAGVLTVSLVFAGQILVFTACALAFLLVITLLEAAEQGRPVETGAGPPHWVGVHWRQLFARVRAVVDWRVVVLGGSLFLGVVAVTALLFLAIPRFQLENSLFLERFVSKKARSGFNDSIKFGEVTEIIQDDSLALSVDVTDRSQIPATPYWRMLVLDEYRSGTFRLSPLQRHNFSREITEIGLRGTARAQRGEPVVWTFYFESGNSRYLPLLGNFDQLRFQEKQNFRVLPDQGVIALRDEPVSMIAYRVEGMEVGDTLPDARFALKLLEPPGPKPSPALPLAHMLALGVPPADQAVLRGVVREITGGAKLSAPDFIRAATRWLGERHRYSTTPQIPAGANDVLIRWMTSREGGHCELFAGSFVLLARAAGFPTRLVTGYKGGTWNAYSNNFTIRNTQAHAWCEVFDLDAHAWRRADPTAGAGTGVPPDDGKGEAALARRTDRSWSARLESLRVFWYRRIVNFDQSSQVETLKAVKEATENSSRKLREALAAFGERIKAWLTSPWDVARLARSAAAIGVVLLPFYLWTHFGRGWWRRWRSDHRGPGQDPIRREASRWLARLRATDGIGPETGPVRAELERLRFGPRASWGDPEKIFRRARQALRRHLRASNLER